MDDGLELELPRKSGIGIGHKKVKLELELNLKIGIGITIFSSNFLENSRILYFSDYFKRHAVFTLVNST